MGVQELYPSPCFVEKRFLFRFRLERQQKQLLAIVRIYVFTEHKQLGILGAVHEFEYG